MHQRRRRHVHRAPALRRQLCRDRRDLLRRLRHRDAHRHVADRRHRAEQLGVAPDDALRQSGRTAGVEHQRVVAAARDRRHRLVLCDDISVRDCSVEQRRVPTVVDLDQQPQGRELTSRSIDEIRERAVEHEHLRVRVAHDVDDLRDAVAVVDVHGARPDLERRVRGLEVLRAVVHELRDLAVVTDAVLGRGLRRAATPGRRGRASGSPCRRARPRRGPADAPRAPPTTSPSCP